MSAPTESTKLDSVTVVPGSNGAIAGDKAAEAIPLVSVSSSAPAASASAVEGAPEEPAKLDFIQETYNVASTSTAHGVVRIVDRQRPMWNRVCWGILWFTAAGLFLTYLVLQSMYLASAPTSTLITHDYNDTTDFPSVSVCISTLQPAVIRAFVKPNPGRNPREQMTSLFQSSGVLCYYGWRSLRQLWGSDFAATTLCREAASLEWVDYPFATSPTLCLKTKPQKAYQAGISMTIIGKVPDMNGFDQLTYGLRRPEEQFEPLLANFLETGLNTRVRFGTTVSTFIKACNDTTGGQPKCLASFQQSCIEKICNCRYPVINDTGANDLPEQLPGSCVVKNLQGQCNYNMTGFPCPAGVNPASRPNGCTLNDVCGSDQARRACPLPSCVDTAYPQSASVAFIDPAIFNETGVINATDAMNGLFILSVILNSQTVTLAQEVVAYTPLSYFGAVGGMVSLIERVLEGLHVTFGRNLVIVTDPSLFSFRWACFLDSLC